MLYSKAEGGIFFARYSDFVNLQESPAGYGKTKKEALRELRLQEITQPIVDRLNVKHPEHWMVPRLKKFVAGMH